MSIVSEIKCARCDRKYSGVRSRCPYCGARRIGRGKYSEDSDNAKGKMLISVLVMGVLVVAAGVLLFTTPIDAEAGLPAIESPMPPPNGGDDIAVLPGENRPTPRPTPPVDEEYYDDGLGTPTPTPGPEVRSVTITWQNRARDDITMAMGDTLDFSVRIEPIDVEEEIIWTSSNPAVFEVVPLNTEHTQVRVTPQGRGTAVLTVSVGGVEASCWIRVPR